MMALLLVAFICLMAIPPPGPNSIINLRWFERLTKHAAELFASSMPVVLTGDYNVMPTEMDVYKPERWVDDALFRPEVRAAFKTLVAQGWTDAIRKLYPNETIYTFWDYFRNAYGRNAGLRIDHFLLSPHLGKRLVAAGVDRYVRGWEKSSDHAPVWIELGRLTDIFSPFAQVCIAGHRFVGEAYKTNCQRSTLG